MNNRSTRRLPLGAIVLAASALLGMNVLAQDSSTVINAPTAAPEASPTQAAPQLSYGVPQVLQLSKAHIAESTILAYIQNSGTVYNLDAAQIVYLKQQGVPDAVVNAMINQRTRVREAAEQNQAQLNNATASSSQTATIVPEQSTSVPSSSVYIIPDTQTYNYYNYYHWPSYYPYYYGYYGWPYPSVSFSFGYGGYWGGYRGGYRGGYGGSYHYNSGGGFHGGGFRGGGGFHGGGGHHR